MKSRTSRIKRVIEVKRDQTKISYTNKKFSGNRHEAGIKTKIIMAKQNGARIQKRKSKEV